MQKTIATQVTRSGCHLTFQDYFYRTVWLWVHSSPDLRTYVLTLGYIIALQCLIYTYVSYIYVTGFRKTDHIVTIDIARNNDLSIEVAMVFSC